MVPHPKRIVQTTYYYTSESEEPSDAESDDTLWDPRDSESESSDDEHDNESESEVSDSEDGTDYESETEPESDSESLDDPKPYYGKGFRVYFDSREDKRFFMKAFGFN